jgi:hypothetical protein
MSTTAESLGIPADIRAQWRLEMAKVTISDNGTSFAHIQCRHAPLWLATFVLSELATTNKLAGDNRAPSFTSCRTRCAMIAKHFLGERGDLHEGTLRVTYADMQVALSLLEFPGIWTRLKAKKEPLSCVAVAVYSSSAFACAQMAFNNLTLNNLAFSNLALLSPRYKATHPKVHLITYVSGRVEESSHHRAAGAGPTHLGTIPRH